MRANGRSNSAPNLRSLRVPDRSISVIKIAIITAILTVIVLYLKWTASGQTLYFLSLGDFGTGSKAQRAVADQMAVYAARYRPSFIASVGDNVYPAGVQGSDDPLFTDYFESVYRHPSLQIPWYMALGDHDHRGSVAAQITHTQRSATWRMPAQYYLLSVPLGGGHSMDLVFTDSVCLEGATTSDVTERRFSSDYNMSLVGPEEGLEHVRWLDDTLDNSKADWLVVVGHRPVLTAATRNRFPAEPQMSQILQQLLERHKVDVYMNGHDHVGQHLERNGVVYIGNGVGGYGNHGVSVTKDTVWADGTYSGFVLHQVTPTAMTFSFIASNGTQLHKVRLRKEDRRRHKEALR